jgi:hypothetical protein
VKPDITKIIENRIEERQNNLEIDPTTTGSKTGPKL